MRIRTSAVVLSLSSGLLSAAEPVRRGTVALTPCDAEGLDRPALCGTLSVPERRPGRSARRIALRIMVLPARAAAARPDPVFAIAGGPGQSATGIAGHVARDHDRTLAEREVVLVDQRGTGGSHRLECRQHPDSDPRRYLSGGFNLEAIRACRAGLEKDADLTAYTTEDAVEDLEDVRQAMGYGTVNLDGGSYGTRVVLRFLRRHPRSVRTATLRAVSPPDYALPLPFARAGQEALDRLFEACARDGACGRTFPDLRREFAGLLASLERAPVRVEITNPVTGEKPAATIDREIFATRVHLLLFAGPLAARLPLLIHQAAGGDWAPFAQLAADFGRAIVEQVDLGLQLSVACAEDAPRLRQADLAAATAGTFLGAGRVRQLLAACALWPSRPMPRDFYAPVRSDVPALVVSGQRDPVTPPRFGEQVLRGLRRGRHVVVPGGSHVDGGECVNGLVARFIAKGSADGLDTACLAGLAAPAFAVQ